MLRDFLQPKLGKMLSGVENSWLKQYGLTAHTARPSLALVREVFPWQVLSLCASIGWSPYPFARFHLHQHHPQIL